MMLLTAVLGFGIAAVLSSACMSAWLVTLYGKPSQSETYASLSSRAWTCLQSNSSVLLPSMSWRRRNRLQKVLSNAGLIECKPEDYFALQLLSSAAMLSLALFAWGLGVRLSWIKFTQQELFIPLFSLLTIGVLGFTLPIFGLRRMQLRIRQELNYGLPMLLDLLVIGLVAGLNVTAAFKFAIGSLNKSALKSQGQALLSQVQAGVPLSQALQSLAERSVNNGLARFASLVLQSETLGVSLASLLGEHAQQLRQDHFLRIEQRAMQAPVKMLLPLAVCIFPCNFLVLGVPIIAQLLQGAN
jgi:tight adherence protein C